jgi:hypothetical protein
MQIWNSYQVFRRVLATLAANKDERGPRADAIASYGDYLIAHVVFRRLDQSRIDDPDYDWDYELRKVPELTAAAANWLIIEVDRQFGPKSFVKATLTNPDRCRSLVERVISGLLVKSAVPELPPGYGAQRRQNAVPTIVDAGRIDEGTPLTFKARGSREREALDAWLAEDAKRAQATWVNHRSRPLLWAYDGKRYSPTGLVKQIWTLANWTRHPQAVQGPLQWYVQGEGSLADVAWAIQKEYDDEPADVLGETGSAAELEKGRRATAAGRRRASMSKCLECRRPLIS